MEIIWSNKAAKQLEFWKQNNLGIKKRIFALIDNIQQTPYSGKGKPEALKHNLAGLYSRRITEEHRLVYFVNIKNNTLEILICKGHYEYK